MSDFGDFRSNLLQSLLPKLEEEREANERAGMGKKIEQELEARKKQSRIDNPYGFSNFYDLIDADGGFRQAVNALGGSQKKPLYELHHSQTYNMLESYEQFYYLLEYVMEGLRIKEEIQKLLTEYHSNTSESLDIRTELQEALKPLYIELRLMGFNHFDLAQSINELVSNN